MDRYWLTKHGYSRTRLYRTWNSMRQRCTNPNHASYSKYGGSGISVCKEWMNNFVPFKDWAISNGYTDKLTIDRIDSTKNYYPENCRWATYTEQNTHLSKLSTNKSGYTGVHFVKRWNKYLVNICIDYKTKYIGGYTSKQEAVEARNKFIDNNNLLHKKEKYVGD